MRSHEVGSQVHGESCAGASTGPVKCSQTSIWSHPTTRCRSPRCQRSRRHRRQMPRARRPNARQNRRRTLARPPLLQTASLQLRSHAAQVSRPAGPRFDERCFGHVPPEYATDWRRLLPDLGYSPAHLPGDRSARRNAVRAGGATHHVRIPAPPHLRPWAGMARIPAGGAG